MLLRNKTHEVRCVSSCLWCLHFEEMSILSTFLVIPRWEKLVVLGEDQPTDNNLFFQAQSDGWMSSTPTEMWNLSGLQGRGKKEISLCACCTRIWKWKPAREIFTLSGKPRIWKVWNCSVFCLAFPCHPDPEMVYVESCLNHKFNLLSEILTDFSRRAESCSETAGPFTPTTCLISAVLATLCLMPFSAGILLKELVVKSIFVMFRWQ